MAAIDDEHSSPRKLPSIRRALLWLGIACTVPTILVASAAAYETICCARSASTRRPSAWRARSSRNWSASCAASNPACGYWRRPRNCNRQAGRLPPPAAGCAAIAECRWLRAIGQPRHAGGQQQRAPIPAPDQKRPAGRDPAAGPIAAGRRHEPVQHRPARRADHRRRDSGDPARPGPVRPVRRDQATAHQPDPAPAGVAGGMGRRRAGQGRR